jgi:ribosomal protein S18 acetylase RimI-like enzyme
LVQNSMEFSKVSGDRRQFYDLLLLADEQEEMIARYIDRGDMFVLTDKGRVCGQCIVTQEGDGIYEIKSISVCPEYQNKGVGSRIVRHCLKYYVNWREFRAGTGDAPGGTVVFYEKLGFQRYGTIKDFFTLNYDHPIVENGCLLKDMIMLRKVR